MPKIKQNINETKEVPKPSEGELICVIKKLVGADHVIVFCTDGKERMGRIPGKMRKRIWLREGDVVLVAPWEFQDKKCDIIYKYNNDDLKKLFEEKIISKEIIENLLQS